MADKQRSKEIDEVSKRLERLLNDASINPNNDKNLLMAMSVTTEELNVAIEELKIQSLQLAEARDSAEAERRRYYDLFDLAPDGYIVTDLNLVIVEANIAAGALLRVKPSLLSGKPLTVFFNRATRDQIFAFIRHFEEGKIERLDDIQVSIIPRDSSPFSASLTISATFDKRNKRSGLRWMIRDITQRRELEYQIEFHSKQLEQSNSDLQQFAFIAAHDLKEPLRIISNYSQLLSKDKTSNLSLAGKSYLETIIESTAKMLSLVKDLLSYSTILETTVADEKVTLNIALDDAISECQLLIKESRATVNIGPVPAITVPRSRFSQVLKNLIGNSLKFRSERRPHIEISFEENQQAIHVAIRDNGIGIESGYEEKIFSMFQRLHSESEFPGNGIGLALCKKIVNTWGGNIWFESNYGQSTTFVFTYPVNE